MSKIRTITVTDRGQIAIPSDMRADLGIARGDKLIALKRDDGDGINLVKVDAMEGFLEKFSKD